MESDNTYSGIAPSGNNPEPVEKETKGAGMLKPEYITNIQGSDFVNFAGLLDVAHQIGLNNISTEMIQSDFEKNSFVFKAIVTLKDESTYEAYGDASTANVGNMIKNHALRMAETRAIARALRWATNIGICSKDEVDFDKEKGEDNGIEAS